MRKMIMYVEERQYEALRKTAYEQRTTMSDIIREAIDRFLGVSGMVEVNGEMVSFETALSLMDEQIREDLHQELAPCTDQEFVDAYIERHLEKFGEEFTVS